jgi:hypothetical protein
MSGAEVDEVIAAAITAQAAEDESQRRAIGCCDARTRQRSSRMFTFQKCSKFVISSYSATGTGPFPSTIKMNGPF